MSTIGQNDRRIQYSTAGGESSFAYDFQIDDADHVDVYREGVLQTRGTHYSVTGVGSSSGGTIVPDGSLTIASGETWTIEGDTPEDRSNDYSGFARVQPATIDADLDRMIFMMQQLRRDSDRSIRVSIDDQSPASDLLLPGSTARSDKAIGFDENGAITVFSDLPAGATPGNIDDTVSDNDMLRWDTLDGEFKKVEVAQQALVGRKGGDVEDIPVGKHEVAGREEADAGTISVGILGKPASLSALQALDTSAFSAGETVYMRGRTSAGDGGEGHFRWDSSDLSTEVGNDEVTTNEGDGGIYIAPASDKTGASGAWVRQFSGWFNVLWWGAKADASTDNTTAINTATNFIATQYSGGVLFFPRRDSNQYNHSSTLYFYGPDVRLQGEGHVQIKYTGAGTQLSADPDTHTGGTYTVHFRCGFSGIYWFTDTGAISIDLSGFSYGTFFDFLVQNQTSGGKCFMGKGEDGTGPYYNSIFAFYMGGVGADKSQIGFSFEGGAHSGGSNGPNANNIFGCKRAFSLSKVVDLQVGDGNTFSHIHGESIKDAYFDLNNTSAVESGTSSGAGTDSTLVDTSKAWTSQQFVNNAVKITGGTGAGQVRFIASNNTDTLTIHPYWETVPDGTSTYEIYDDDAKGNKFSNLRAEGLGSDAPDFIHIRPGARNNSFTEYYPVSVGTTVNDEYGDPSNVTVDGDLILLHEFLFEPGASYSQHQWPRNGPKGGVRIGRKFVVEYLQVFASERNAGSATITLDVGGSTVGGGSPSLVAVIDDTNDEGCTVYPSDKSLQESANNGLFLNVQTDGSWSAAADLNIVVAVRQVN